MPIRPFSQIPQNIVEWSRFFQQTQVTPDDGSVGGDTIQDGSVTFAKIQNVSPDRLLGRDTSPAGQVQELTVTGGLEFTGSGIQRSALTGDIVAAAGNSATAFRDLSACSVLGRSANTAGAPAEITAGSNGHFMRRSSDAVAFGPIVASDIATSILNSGTYTPTLTSVANLDSTTAYPFQYLRVGSVVTVSGRIDADPTAGGSATTQVRISLPIATTFASTSNCCGTGQSSAITQGAAIFADTTNHDAVLSWFSGSTSSHNMFLTFTYLIA